MSGRTYVILHPVYHKHRNKKIAQSAGIRLALHTKDIRVLNLDTQNLELACTSDMQPNAAATATYSERNAALRFVMKTTAITGRSRAPGCRRGYMPLLTPRHLKGEDEYS